MYLRNISYEIWNKKLLVWKVSNVTLERLGLLVGKNATGKSRFLGVIGDIASRFGSKIHHAWSVDYLVFENEFDYKSHWEFDFIDADKNSYQYSMVIGFQRIIEENLVYNGMTVLKRNKDNALLYSNQSRQFLKIQPPNNKLTFQVRRDLLEFPFFEKIIMWSENTAILNFSDSDNEFDDEKVVQIFKKLSKTQIDSIIDSMNSIGFQVEKIKARKGGIEYISLKERDIKQELAPFELSRGMFRALSILINIEFLQKKEASLIAIDDLGEGLDYERATKLGKLLVEKLENSNIQFIATSNDNFLMDVIPIKYWNILQREGNAVRALNYHNSKEAFDEFKLSGLSNFYLFSSDFLTQQQD